jgi:hypothetical protein
VLLEEFLEKTKFVITDSVRFGPSILVDQAKITMSCQSDSDQDSSFKCGQIPEDQTIKRLPVEENNKIKLHIFGVLSKLMILYI